MRRFLLLILLTCSPAWATILQVQHKEGTSNANANTVTVTGMSNFTAGNTMIVGTTAGASQTITGVSDGTNTYVQGSSCRAVSGGGRATDFWYAKNISAVTSPTITVTYSATSTQRKEVYAQEVSGLSATSPFERCGTGTGTGSECTGSPVFCTGASVTTTNANDYIMAIMRTNGTPGSPTFACGGGFTYDDSSNQAGMSCHNIVSSTGTYTPTFETASGTDQAYSTAAFTAASGGAVVRHRAWSTNQ